MDSGAELSARGWFQLMVRTRLAPGLRTCGFIGSGHTFRAELDGYYGQVSLHEVDVPSTRFVRFTVDLSLLARTEWDDQLRVRPYYGARPQPSAGVAWTARIGDVVTVAGYPIGELWWELDAGRPFESLADEVVSAVSRFGLPALRTHIPSSPHPDH